jgi:putative hemolysin
MDEEQSRSSTLQKRRSVKLRDWQSGYFRLPCELSRRTRHCRSRAGARHGMCELTNGTACARHAMCELTNGTACAQHAMCELMNGTACARHAMCELTNGTACARHAMCESAFTFTSNLSLGFTLATLPSGSPTKIL